MNKITALSFGKRQDRCFFIEFIVPSMIEGLEEMKRKETKQDRIKNCINIIQHLRISLGL